MSDQGNNQIAEISAVIAEKRGWFIALGILLIILGVRIHVPF